MPNMPTYQRLNDGKANGIADYDHYDDNHNDQHSHDNNSTSVALEPDDGTMNVPLLSDNHDGEHSHIKCLCKQLGFSENLLKKSAQEAKYKIALVLTLCCVFMVFEFVGGYLAGSLAIMADAAHLASDCIGFIIGLLAIWVGGLPADGKMSFGYKRWEVFGALISVLGIWTLSATLLMLALRQLRYKVYELDADTMIPISAVGIIINLIMVYILHGSAFMPHGSHGHSHSHSHSHSHDSHIEATMSAEVNGVKSASNDPNCNHEKNLNLRAAMIHVIGDLVQSIGVFLASIVMKIYPSARFVDPLCTILFTVIVLTTTVRLVRDSVSILLDAVPRDISLQQLEADLALIEGVKSVHHVNVWNHTNNYRVLMAHLVIDLLSDNNTVLKRATQLACSPKYKIKHCTIQIERLTS